MVVADTYIKHLAAPTGQPGRMQHLDNIAVQQQPHLH